MTMIPLFACILVVCSMAVGIAVLPWSDVATEESWQTWRLAAQRVRAAAVAPLSKEPVLAWQRVRAESGVQPPLPPPVWAPPVSERARCA